MPIEWLLLLVVAPVVIVAILIVLITRRHTPRGLGLSKVETWTVSVVGTGAMLTVVGGTLLLISSAVINFSYDPIMIDDAPYSGSPVARLVDVPHITESGYSSVWFYATGVPIGTRWLLYLELALPGLAVIAIGVAVSWLAIAILRGRPFTRAVPVVISVAALAVMISGVGSQAAGALGRAAVVDYLGAEQVTAGSSGPGLAYLEWSVDLSPIGWALGLALVAAAFQIGIRLQRESDLLV